MKLLQFTLSFLLFFSLTTQAQYTETINSNKPGGSDGAYSVGKNVWQAEGGFFYNKNKHELRKQDFGGGGIDYQLRYGIWKEQLEVNLTGSFQFGKITDNVTNTSSGVSNFKFNTIGAKYLVYDPYKDYVDKPNLMSWKANHKFKWRTLLPSVAVFAGMNLNLTNTPFVYGSNFNFNGIEEPSFSPKIMIVTQHNWTGGWVFTTNLIADRVFMTDYPRYSYILTLTHAINEKIAVFGETQGIMNDVYADNLIRFGGAYLFNKDIQIDLGISVNTKNTPSLFGLNLGLSYRLDFHVDPDNNNDAEDEKERKENAAGKNKKKNKKKDGDVEKEQKSQKDENTFD